MKILLKYTKSLYLTHKSHAFSFMVFKINAIEFWMFLYILLFICDCTGLFDLKCLLPNYYFL